MKLMDMTADKAADVMARISGSVGAMLDDDKIMKLMGDVSKAGKKSAAKGYALILTKIVPACLTDHKRELFEVVGALDDKTSEAVGKLPFRDIITIIKESFDEELKDFFGSLLGWKKTEDKQ